MPVYLKTYDESQGLDLQPNMMQLCRALFSASKNKLKQKKINL